MTDKDNMKYSANGLSYVPVLWIFLIYLPLREMCLDFKGCHRIDSVGHYNERKRKITMQHNETEGKHLKAARVIRIVFL